MCVGVPNVHTSTSAKTAAQTSAHLWLVLLSGEILHDLVFGHDVVLELQLPYPPTFAAEPPTITKIQPASNQEPPTDSNPSSPSGKLSFKV